MIGFYRVNCKGFTLYMTKQLLIASLIALISVALSIILYSFVCETRAMSKTKQYQSVDNDFGLCDRNVDKEEEEGKRRLRYHSD